MYRIRIRNRLLQLFYRPRVGRTRLLSASAREALDAIDRRIEETITPLLSELFDE